MHSCPFHPPHHFCISFSKHCFLSVHQQLVNPILSPNRQCFIKCNLMMLFSMTLFKHVSASFKCNNLAGIEAFVNFDAKWLAQFSKENLSTVLFPPAIQSWPATHVAKNESQRAHCWFLRTLQQQLMRNTATTSELLIVLRTMHKVQHTSTRSPCRRRCVCLSP